MTDKALIKQLARQTKALPAVAASAPEAADAEVEARELAGELFAAFTDRLAKYRKGNSDCRTDPREPPSPSEIEDLLNQPPEQLTFFQLERLERGDNAKCLAKWEATKAAARDQLADGWAAARAIEPIGARAWNRARFLAIRERFRAAWPPRNPGESLLIDDIAQCEFLRQHWMEVFSRLSHEPRTLLDLYDQGEKREQTVPMTRAPAAQEALRTVERLQRMLRQSLRTLLTIRGNKSLVIRKANQVNLAAGPQMNVST